MGPILSDRYDAFLSYAYDDNIGNDDVFPQFRWCLKRHFAAEMGHRLDFPGSIEAEVFMDRYGLLTNGDISTGGLITLR